MLMLDDFFNRQGSLRPCERAARQQTWKILAGNASPTLMMLKLEHFTLERSASAMQNNLMGGFGGLPAKVWPRRAFCPTVASASLTTSTTVSSRLPNNPRFFRIDSGSSATADRSMALGQGGKKNTNRNATFSKFELQWPSSYVAVAKISAEIST